MLLNESVISNRTLVLLICVNLILTTFMSCSILGIKPITWKVSNISSDNNEVFNEYKERYAEYYKEHRGTDPKIDEIEFKFGTIKDKNTGRKVIAFCDWYKSPRYIVVDRNYWAAATETNREILVLHELGHCDLDREHNDDLTAKDPNDKNAKQRPVSVMFANIIDDQDYINHKQEYLKELFDENQ